MLHLWGQRAGKSMGLTCEMAANLNFDHSLRPKPLQHMKRHYLALIAALALAACGGGGGGATGSNPSAPPARGTLLQTPPELLSTFTISALLTELELPINQLLLSVSSAPLCDIVFKMPKRFLWLPCLHRKATSWWRRTTPAMTPRPCPIIRI